MLIRNQNEAARLAAIEQDSFDTTAEALAAADRVLALCEKYFKTQAK